MSRRRARPISATEAAALVKSGDWLDYGAALGQPDAFDAALAARRDELHDVRIRGCLAVRPRAVLECDPERQHFQWYSWHFSGYERRKHDEGLCHYIPCNLGEIPDYYRRFIDPVDVLILKARPANAQGVFNFGPTHLWLRAIAERARLVIVETNESVPHVEGDRPGLSVEEVDYVIEGDGVPLTEMPNVPPGEVDRAVARHIIGEIGDGACLQVGIGTMPNAVTSLLAQSGVRDLGVHTEMLTEGIIDLYQRGMVTGARKTLDPGLLTCSFGFGTARFYSALHENRDFSFQPVEQTNLPDRIMRNDNVVSINNTTQVDLQGQACSESSGHRHISGTGGQLQFVRGAYGSRGGKSFICLSSTYERKGVRRSRIVLEPTPGNIVTTPRTDMMYVVTEFGIANLKGRSVCERAHAMIGLAHPDFREELSASARERGLIPKSVY